MLLVATLVRTDVSEEPSASIIRVTRIDELGTALAVTTNRSTLWRNTCVQLTSAAFSALKGKVDRSNVRTKQSYSEYLLDRSRRRRGRGICVLCVI
jgi:hypothetical protein